MMNQVAEGADDDTALIADFAEFHRGMKNVRLSAGIAGMSFMLMCPTYLLTLFSLFASIVLYINGTIVCGRSLRSSRAQQQLYVASLLSFFGLMGCVTAIADPFDLYVYFANTFLAVGFSFITLFCLSSMSLFLGLVNLANHRADVRFQRRAKRFAAYSAGFACLPAGVALVDAFLHLSKIKGDAFTACVVAIIPVGFAFCAFLFSSVDHLIELKNGPLSIAINLDA